MEGREGNEVRIRHKVLFPKTNRLKQMNGLPLLISPPILAHLLSNQKYVVARN